MSAWATSNIVEKVRQQQAAEVSAAKPAEKEAKVTEEASAKPAQPTEEAAKQGESCAPAPAAADVETAAVDAVELPKPKSEEAEEVAYGPVVLPRELAALVSDDFLFVGQLGNSPAEAAAPPSAAQQTPRQPPAAKPARATRTPPGPRSASHVAQQPSPQVQQPNAHPHPYHGPHHMMPQMFTPYQRPPSVLNTGFGEIPRLYAMRYNHDGHDGAAGYPSSHPYPAFNSQAMPYNPAYIHRANAAMVANNILHLQPLPPYYPPH